MVRLPRKLDMALTGKRHPFFARFRAGFEPDGLLRGVALELYSDGGWSLDLSDPVMWRALFHCDNAYRIPALDAYRLGLQNPQDFADRLPRLRRSPGNARIEEILDRIARTLDIEPHRVRERELLSRRRFTHYGQPVKDAGRIPLIWNRVKVQANSTGVAVK